MVGPIDALQEEESNVRLVPPFPTFFNQKSGKIVQKFVCCFWAFED